MLEPNGYFFKAEEIASDDLTIGPPDAENQVHNGTGPYAIGDEVFAGGHTFRSLVDANTAATSDGASWLDLGETDYGADLWTAGTYAKDVYKVLNGRVYKSAEASNAEEPGTGTKWTDYGPTNRFRAFDLRSETIATSTGEISWTFDCPYSMNAIVLVAPIGAFAYVSIKDSEGDELEGYEVATPHTVRLTRDSGGGPYNHDFSPISRVSHVIIDNIPPGTGKEVTVRIDGAETGEVGVGQIAHGFAYDLGVVTVGSRVSTGVLKEPTVDDFGNVTFYARKGRSVGFNVKNIITLTDNTMSNIEQALNAPAAMFMTDGVAYGMCVFGYLKNVDFGHESSVLTSPFIEMKGFVFR